MGPRSEDRGNALNIAHHVAEKYASMGPRSEDRGNDLLHGVRRTETRQLQWGRDLKIAEI